MTLSFRQYDQAGELVSNWAPDRSGDYEEQCTRGRAYAEELLDHMRETGATPLLGFVVREFPRPPSGVEIGFLQSIAEVAIE